MTPLEERKKKVDAHLQHTWNLLYISANSAADAASAQLGVSKSDLFGKDAENAAVPRQQELHLLHSSTSACILMITNTTISSHCQ